MPRFQEPIASLENPQVRLARSLLDAPGRRRYRAFLVEGLRLVEAASLQSAPSLVLHVSHFGQHDARERGLLRHLRGVGVSLRPVTERVLSHITDTVTPQGIVAVVPLPGQDEPHVRTHSENLQGGRAAPAALTLVLDAVTDPGNVGTLLRSAAGAGATAVVAMRGTVDLYSPKVVRAGAGAHFALIIESGSDWGDLLATVPEAAQVLLADAAASTPYWEADLTKPTWIVVGNEAHGASEEAREAAGASIAIPLYDAESLNAGVAGSIILFEAMRQRTLGRK